MRAPFGTSLLSRLRRDPRGASAVEFALIAPMLFVLAAGAVDGSRFIIQTMQARAAAQAGADFALRHGWDASGIQGAVTAATALPVTATPAPTEATGCVVSGLVANAGCPANGPSVGTFVTVSAQNSFAPLLAWPGLPASSTINAQAEIRIP
ncbi:MAG TPA: TadE/TadG family type IV pilus assembly protein [Phenylobacterium sp.]|jgi:Flp pilus assembly protein TadG|nr:TadE/TadG family type IV pilus assembly protein [Phenylobacterium sp.]